MKYVKLLRLSEHYLQIGSVIAVGIYLHLKYSEFLWWAIAVTFFSITAFMLNELTDRQDTDKYSWNKIHIGPNEKFDTKILVLMFAVFSFLGLIISYLIGLFNFGISIFIIGIFYSLKPIRLKGRFCLDILAQILVWIVLPFIALVNLHTEIITVLPFIISLSFIIWACIFPYQLADYQADLKAKLKTTHTVLGMRRSLWFGLICAFIGVIFYLYLGIYKVAPWAGIMLLFVGYAIFEYIYWLRLTNINDQTKSMQKYSQRVIPLSQLIIPYLLLVYILQ